MPPSHRRRQRLLAAATLLTLAPALRADTRTYVGPAVGTFSLPANWSPAGLPTPADDALLSPSTPTDPYSILFNTPGLYQLNSLTLNSPSPTNPLTFNLYPSYVTITSQLSAASEIVGSTGDATLVQSNHLNLPSTLSIADSPASAGTYRLNGGILASDTAYVGRAGAGTFSLTTGTLQATNLYLAASPTASATFTQSGGSNLSTNLLLATAPASSANYALAAGSLSPASLYVGYAGAATFAQSGGTAGRPTFSSFGTAASTSLLLGYNPGSAGTYALSAGNLYDALLYVGFSGTGSFLQTGGFHSLAPSSASGTTANLYLGYNPASTGTYALSGGSLYTPSLYVGYSGTGSFTHAGTGTVSLTSYGSPNTGLYLGYNPGSNGTYSFSAPFLSDAAAYVGFAGAGTFAQSAGSHSVSYSLFLAYAPGSAGLYSLTGGSLQASSLFVGYNGAGTFAQSAGQVSTYNGIFIGNNASPGSAYLLSGNATLSNSSTLTVGNAAPGTFVQSGGTVSGSGKLFVGNAGPGSYTLSAGSLSTGNEYVGTNSGHGTFTQTGGTHTAFVLGLAYSSPSQPPVPDAGSYALAAGSLSVSVEYLGYTGPATFTQTGGTHTISNNLYLGTNPTSYSAGRALFILSAGTLSASYETFGSSSLPAPPPSTFLQTGGTNLTNYLQPYAGSYTLAGGTLSIGSPIPSYSNNSFTWSWTGGTLAFPNGYSLSTNPSLSSPLASPLTLSSTQTLSGGGYCANPTNSTLNLAGGTLAGTGSFSNSGTLTGHGTIATRSFTNSGTLALSNGPTTVAAPLTNNATFTLQNATVSFIPTLTSSGSISLTNSSASFAAALVGYGQIGGNGGFLTLDAASSLTARYLFQHNVNSAGSITLLAPTPSSTIDVLTLASTATFDLTQNTLNLTNTPLDTVRQYLATGQLLSSAADAAHTLGYLTFPLSTKVEITLTLIGDANLDHQLTPDDYALLDRSLAKHTANPHWSDGDFNYDGIINSQDYLLLDTAYLATHPAEAITLLPQRESQFGPDYASQLIASLPEPSSLIACGFALPTLLPRRRRAR